MKISIVIANGESFVAALPASVQRTESAIQNWISETFSVDIVDWKILPAQPQRTIIEVFPCNAESFVVTLPPSVNANDEDAVKQFIKVRIESYAILSSARN